MKDIKKVSYIADQLELLGILGKWYKKKRNEDLTRAIELVQKLVFIINEQDMEIEDLKAMNSFIREEKNKEILKLKR